MEKTKLEANLTKSSRKAGRCDRCHVKADLWTDPDGDNRYCRRCAKWTVLKHKVLVHK